MGEMKNACWILFRKPERKRPLERPRLRLEDHTEMHVNELGCEDVNWIHLAQSLFQLSS
jgi:hypothetical protein